MQDCNETVNWIRLTTCPLQTFCKPIVFGKDEGIIIAPHGKCKSIQIYHIQKNKWTDFVHFKTQIEMKYNTIVMSPLSNNTLYLYDGKQYELDSIQKTLIKIKKKAFQLDLKNKKGAYLDSCILNKAFHIIGGANSLTHLSWNIITDSITNHSFYSDNNNKPNIKDFGLIPVQSTNRIIMLGGRDDSRFRGYLRSIYIAQLSQNDNTTFIWSKSQYEMPHAMSHFGCIITDDQKYIIVFGGKTKSRGSIDEISILNLETWRWTKSNVKCPKKNKYFAVKTSFSDDIHLFDKSGNHFKMHLSNIMTTKYRKYQITFPRSKYFNLLIKDKYEWTKCKNVPYPGYCKPVVTNNGSIIVAPFNQKQLIIYDNVGMNWKIFMKYPNDTNLNTANHTITLDLQLNIIYLFDGRFTEFNLDTKTMRMYGKIVNVGKNPVSLMLHDTLHVIGSKHLSWENSSFIEHKINAAPQYNTIQNQGIVSLESSKQILMFGGNERNVWNGEIDTMWICNTDNNYIWKRLFCIMPHPMYGFGYILTKNERYIITFGGRTKNGFIDNIYILNLLTFEWIAGGKCPKKAMYHSILVNDDIHLFEIGSTKHWKLSLLSIFSQNKKYNTLRAQKLNTNGSIEHKEEESPKQQMRQLLLSQQILIKALKMELQETKCKLLKSENDKRIFSDENANLRSENTTLRNNITKSLDKILSVNVGSTYNTNQRFNGSNRLLRKLQKSDTFMLLTDEDFETDEEVDENDTETDEEEVDDYYIC